MNSLTPLIGKNIIYSAVQSRPNPQTKKTEHRRVELTATVVEVSETKRTVTLSDENVFRWEDVTIVAVEGVPYETFLNPPPAAPPPATRWNPKLKNVSNHQTGEVHLDATNYARGELGLEIPWNPEIGKKEYSQPAVKISEDLAAQIAELVGADH
jgi:hypothetical protein